jgi:hypothetical protein
MSHRSQIIRTLTFKREIIYNTNWTPLDQWRVPKERPVVNRSFNGVTEQRFEKNLKLLFSYFLYFNFDFSKQ